MILKLVKKNVLKQRGKCLFVLCILEIERAHSCIYINTTVLKYFVGHHLLYRSEGSI